MQNYTYRYNPISDSFDIVQDLSLIHMKDPVNTYDDLPITGNGENDARFVKDADILYVWSIADQEGILSDWKETARLSIPDLDSLDDGSIYGKVKLAELFEGQVKRLDDGTNEVSAEDAKDAVDKKHVIDPDGVLILLETGVNLSIGYGLRNVGGYLQPHADDTTIELGGAIPKLRVKDSGITYDKINDNVASGIAGTGLKADEGVLDLDFNSLPDAGSDIASNEDYIVMLDFDGSISKKATIDTLVSSLVRFDGGINNLGSQFVLDFNSLNSAVVNVATDSIAIIDVDDSNKTKQESIADFVSGIAGTGLTATDGVLNSHLQNSDTKLDNGQANEVTSVDLRGHLDSVANPHVVTVDQLDLASGTVAGDIDDAISKKHTHSNKTLLDTYTQTEVDLADAVSKKHAQNTDIALRTDKLTVDVDGNTTIAGELKIKVYSQDAEPDLGDQRLAMWIDTNDSDRVYLIFRRGSGDQVAVELA